MEEGRENRLGTMPVPKLLYSISLPIVCSMIVQALYNVVDSIFVARYSEDGLAAVSLAFPVQNLMIAFGVGTAVGMASLLGRRLGEKNQAAANRAAANGIFLALLTYFGFVIFGLTCSDLFFSSYAADPEIGPNVAALGATYMRFVTIGSFGLFQQVIVERLLQATGKSFYSMMSQMTGAVVNIILDPIMIFGYFGFPEMGVAGAALATVIGQWCGMFVGLFLHFTRNKEILVDFKGFRPNPKTIKHIYQVGLPSIVMQSIGSVMTFGMNLILAGFGKVAVSVFGIYFKLQSFVFMPVFGFNTGMVPIVSFNYGARKPERMKQALKVTMITMFGIMVAGTVLFWVIPGTLLSMFDAEAEMLEIGTVALRSISLAFPAAAVSIACSGFFQATGRGVNSLVISLVRQMIVLLPVAWLLARMAGLDLIWYAFPAAEVVALALSLLLLRSTWRRYIAPLAEVKSQDSKL